MKKLGCACLVIILLLAFICPVYADENEEELRGPVINGCHTLDAHVPFLGSHQLIDNARSAVLY